MLKKGFFITFEGGEGSGKSTLIETLASQLKHKKIPFIKTREPGSTTLGEKIRTLLLHSEDISIYSELCLFLASRSEHVERVIFPALKEKKVVLCDRFNDSTIAYQGYARGLDISKVKAFCNFISQDLIPDLTFYLDINPEIALKRFLKRDRIEKENISFHNKIREGFFILLKKEKKRFVVIDGSQKKEDILNIAKDVIFRKLKIQ